MHTQYNTHGILQKVTLRTSNNVNLKWEKYTDRESRVSVWAYIYIYIPLHYNIRATAVLQERERLLHYEL